MTTTDKEKKDADKRETESKVEPIPKRVDFFEWLETLFNGETQFPEKIDVRVVTGKNFVRLGPLIKQYHFGPDDWQETSKKPKPTRSKIVALSHEILQRCQQDCDVARKATVYGVHVAHFKRETEFYERWLLRMTPSPVHQNEEYREGQETGEDETEGKTPAERYSMQALEHDERMFSLVGGMAESLIDRYDRREQSDRAEIDALRRSNREQAEMLEKALSLKDERDAAREWRQVGTQAAARGIEMGTNLMPALVNHFTGKPLMPTSETPESIALKAFFRKTDKGGLLTYEQANAAFGTWGDKPPHELLRPGILSLEQGKLLYDVSECHISADNLEKVMPGGAIEITTEQVVALQQIFAMDQIAPLFALFASRLAKKNPPPPTKEPTP